MNKGDDVALNILAHHLRELSNALNLASNELVSCLQVLGPMVPTDGRTVKQVGVDRQILTGIVNRARIAVSALDDAVDANDQQARVVYQWAEIVRGKKQ